ncbi:hypothetical protein PINS_up019109 [Pythium insidiosum]|nr:hypothetical protein PINS_up019109 [Pythium insidiosum]
MEDDKTADAIIDLMDMELGDSSVKQDVSARSKFNSFLATVEYGRSFEALRKRDVTTELAGKFCSFLLQDGISWQTSMNYLSSTKRQLETIVKTDLFKRESEWYKRCRRNLHQQFVLQAIKTGKPLKDQAPMMTLEDLEEMAKRLFLQNNTVALMDRTLLNNQWLSIGRSSDISNLLFDDLHWLDRFLVIDVPR